MSSPRDSTPGPGAARRRRLPRAASWGIAALAVLVAGVLVLVLTRQEAALGPAPRVSDVTAPLDPALLASDIDYVALGDSFTSGPGLAPASSEMPGCRRSEAGYPALFASAVGARLQNVSCIGARTENVRVEQQLPQVGVEVPPQAASLTSDVELVSVSLGGNDGGLFGRLIGTCSGTAGDPAATSSCLRLFGEDARARAEEEQRLNLVEVVEEVREAAPSARVVLVGYPAIFDGECERSTMSSAASEEADAMVRALNSGAEQAAIETGVRYVDVHQASEEHGVCSAEPWVNGAVAIPGQAWAWHPLPAGMRGVAAVMVAQLLEERD